MRSDIVFEADVRPVIGRMEQAAYDVLLNSETWRDPSTSRRTLWQPKSGTTSADGAALIIQHATPETQILDEFGAYPMDLAGVITTRPSNWWPRKDAPSSESTGAGVKIIPADEPSGAD